MEAEAQDPLSSAGARIACPSCGGAGGGPFGRAGSVWDDEDYVCPRCEGAGAIALDPNPHPQALTSPPSRRPSGAPGIVKATPEGVEISGEAQAKKRKASA